MKKYWHRLTPGLVSALIKINKAVNLKKKNDIRIDRLPEELALTHVERCNWQKLRLHGLIARVKENGEVKRGRWCITRKGYQFLGGVRIPRRVLSFRNRVEGHSPEDANISEVLRSTPYFESIDDIQFEYAQPEIEGEMEAEIVPIVPGKKRLKKGQTPCPTCGEAMGKKMETYDTHEPNTLGMKTWFECPECGYNENTK